MRSARIGATAIVAILVAACAGSPSRPPATVTTAAPQPTATAAGGGGVLPQIVSTERGVGRNRLVMGLLDASGTRPVGAPDTILGATFTGPNGEEVGPVEADFIWAIENEVGIYAAQVDFPVAGAWTADFEITFADARVEEVPFEFDVQEDTSVLRPGEQAPAVETPTADDVDGDLAQLSTDDDPEPAFYERSVADALAAGEPFVLAFATPKFCASRTCGPTLDRLKPVAEDYPDVTFINVEPYQLELVEGQLQPILDANQQLQAVEAVTEFGLLSEPYLFVVDGNGTITSSFETIVGEPELRTALDELTEG